MEISELAIDELFCPAKSSGLVDELGIQKTVAVGGVK